MCKYRFWIALIGLGLFGVVGVAEVIPYKAGQAVIDGENYQVGKLLSIPWGAEKEQVGRYPMHTRGALSYSPRYISVSATGTIYVGDEVNERILYFAADGKLISSFAAAYGGYHMFVDKNDHIYTVFRRPFEPFTIAVYHEEKVIREIALSPFNRNPAGDRIWVDCNGGLHFNLVQQYQPLTKLTEPEERPMTMENLITGAEWSYTAACRKATLGKMHNGYLSRFFDKVYAPGEDGLVVHTMQGAELARFAVREVVRSRIGLEKGVSLDVPRAIRVFAEDPAGNIYLLVRNRTRGPAKSAFSIVKFSPGGNAIFATDTFPNGIHYGSEVQLYPSSLTVGSDGSIYQLCTEGEIGVRIMKWSK